MFEEKLNKNYRKFTKQGEIGAKLNQNEKDEEILDMNRRNILVGEERSRRNNQQNCDFRPLDNYREKLTTRRLHTFRQPFVRVAITEKTNFPNSKSKKRKTAPNLILENKIKEKINH